MPFQCCCFFFGTREPRTPPQPLDKSSSNFPTDVERGSEFENELSAVKGPPPAYFPDRRGEECGEGQEEGVVEGPGSGVVGWRK